MKRLSEIRMGIFMGPYNYSIGFKNASKINTGLERRKKTGPGYPHPRPYLQTMKLRCMNMDSIVQAI